ncbi:Crp/Fnr family transcriptional regulator [Persicitalea sp.]|uniref:Crp/Fnr family transcriptional regulator n=1 Tax=Persicitalea sp. TaxID=3100273 RepID=UPI0035930CAD
MSQARTKVWYFENFNILKALSPNEKQALAGASAMRKIPKNSIIYFPDDEDRKLYFVKEGKVKISFYSSEGKEMILSLLSPGELFGELAILGESTRGEIAEVVEDTLICSISIDQLENILVKNAVFNRQITKLIGLRLRKVQSRLTSLVFKSAPERIRAFIKELADEHGQMLLTGQKEVKLHLTHEEIAKLTATARQSVTSVFSELEKAGIIAYDRHRILVIDYDRL